MVLNELGESTLDVVSREIKRLVNGGGVTPENNFVLTPTRSSSELFISEISGIPTQPSGQIQPGKIVVETIHSFKGQERSVVILAKIHRSEPAQADCLRYLAMSRAVHELVVVN